MQSIWQTISTVATVFSVAVALFAAYQSRQSSNNSLLATQQSALQNQIQLYITQHMEVRDALPNGMDNSSDYENFDKSSKIKVQIVAGLLVGVVDLMYLSNDIRTNEWKLFIKSIPGPLYDKSGFELKNYSSTNFTRRLIDEYRKGD